MSWFVFKLVSGKTVGTTDINTLKESIWLEKIDWSKTAKHQFKGMKMPEWLGCSAEFLELVPDK